MLNLNCASTNPITGEEEIHYPLIDTRLKIHHYKENIQWMIFPKHNKKLTQYCSLHRDWEDIRAVWSKNSGDDYRWQYYVVKNKKSFK